MQGRAGQKSGKDFPHGDIKAERGELQHAIGYRPSEFAGLMGAFGRRLVNTQGYIDPSWLFDNQWQGEQGCNRYRLPDSVRAAAEKAGLV